MTPLNGSQLVGILRNRHLHSDGCLRTREKGTGSGDGVGVTESCLINSQLAGADIDRILTPTNKPRNQQLKLSLFQLELEAGKAFRFPPLKISCKTNESCKDVQYRVNKPNQIIKICII